MLLNDLYALLELIREYNEEWADELLDLWGDIEIVYALNATSQGVQLSQTENDGINAVLQKMGFLANTWINNLYNV